MAVLPKNLNRRSVTALVVVTLSFFLLMCVSKYGRVDFEALRAGHPVSLGARIAEPLVGVFGAGVYVLALLPLAWGVIVYFNEKTPDLIVRACGTVVLVVSVAMIAGLIDGGRSALWAGALGTAAARALGGLGGPLGAFGTVLAWLVALTLFGVSLILATDWMFHSIRVAGRRKDEVDVAIAVEPPVAEFLEHPAQAEPREFVRETPRAPEVADDEILFAETETSIEEPTPPEGWSSSRSESGRMLIAAPSGYRGVEFLPTSDELAVPVDVTPSPIEHRTYESPAAESSEFGLGLDDELLIVAGDVAYSPETPAPLEAAEDDTQPIEIGGEMPAQEEPISDEIEEAVQTLFEAVTASAPAPEPSPASGIGLAEETQFVDEFYFALDAVETETAIEGGRDGASAANEMAASRAASQTPVEAPAPAAAVEVETPAFDEVIVERFPVALLADELLVAAEPAAEEAPAAAIAEPVVETAPESSGSFVETPTPSPVEVLVDAGPASEGAPEPIAATSVSPAAVEAVVAHPAPARQPDLPLFAAVAEMPHASAGSAPESEPLSGISAAPGVDLSRLHSMELDPLFHDAMEAVLERGRASAVVLQRKLGIGYARGIRILDQMTAAGLVGPDSPTGARDIRVSTDAWKTFV